MTMVWFGNVSILLLLVAMFCVVSNRVKNRRGVRADVVNHEVAWGHFMHGGRWLHQEHCITLFDARVLLYPVHQGGSDSAWDWVRACLPAEVTVPMNAPTPAELERVIRSNERARRALIAQRMNDEEERTFFPFQMLASMAMSSAVQGAPDRPWLHGAVGRPWLVEDFNQRTKDVILQDIGLRCHAVELLRLGLRPGRCRTPQAKRFGLSTSTVAAETALPDSRPCLKWIDLQCNEKGPLPLTA